MKKVYQVDFDRLADKTVIAGLCVAEGRSSYVIAEGEQFCADSQWYLMYYLCCIRFHGNM